MLAKVRIGTTASRVAIAAMRTMIPRGVRTVFTTKFPFISQIPWASLSKNYEDTFEEMLLTMGSSCVYTRLEPTQVYQKRKAPLDAQGERAAVGRPLAAFLWLEALQLAAMPDQRRDAHQPRIIRLPFSSHGTVGQHPGIDTVGLPHLCQLLPRFLQTQLVAQNFRLVPPPGLDRSQLREFLVEPRLAHFKWGKAAIPAALAGPGAGFDVFHYKDAHREELAQQGRQAQFPVPARSSRRRQLLLALPARCARLAAGGLAPSTGVAHARAAPFRLLDTTPGFCLDSGIGMSGTQHTVSLPLAPRIDPHRNTLHDARRRLER